MRSPRTRGITRGLLVKLRRMLSMSLSTRHQWRKVHLVVIVLCKVHSLSRLDRVTTVCGLVSRFL